jgi:membrane fusion protein, adhesin transport system
MLNISENSIEDRIGVEAYNSFERHRIPQSKRIFRFWVWGIFIIVFIILFLPWTQNIQSTGLVTTLLPGQRPQTIHATIAGRVEKWFVREGQFVKKGDTIAFLSEVKTDYFDPNLVGRTKGQITAKEGSIVSYNSKADALDRQIAAFRNELNVKRNQIKNKIQQNALKVESDIQDIEAQKVDYDIATKQLARQKELYEKGLKSLTELEQRKNKYQEANAKLVSVTNKLEISKNELANSKLEMTATENEYANKIAKAESEKYSAISDMFDATTTVNKMEIDLANYKARSAFYYITAPQDCFINKAIVPGVGETVKEGDPLVNILPKEIELAVEMFVDPMNLPLISKGAPVQFIFDGWPAFVFTGWPNQSVGTFKGKITAIENYISENGKYRVLIVPDTIKKAWPKELRPGTGANAVALLQDVPVWYELWRQVNGFPPDFYASIEEKKHSKNDKVSKK